MGIQPCKINQNLYNAIPIKLNPKGEPEYINILTRTKIRKLTIIEPLTETATPESTLERATAKAVALANILHSDKGQEWYKMLGFHGRCTEHLKIKVCIAIPKNLKAKCKEFEPYELKANNDSIEVHHLIFDTDGTKITSIKTTLND